MNIRKVELDKLYELTNIEIINLAESKISETFTKP